MNAVVELYEFYRSRVHGRCKAAESYFDKCRRVLERLSRVACCRPLNRPRVHLWLSPEQEKLDSRPVLWGGTMDPKFVGVRRFVLWAVPPHEGRLPRSSEVRAVSVRVSELDTASSADGLSRLVRERARAVYEAVDELVCFRIMHL